MATHASILAWGFPWTEELGWLQVHAVTKSQTCSRDRTTIHIIACEIGSYRETAV